MQSLLQTQQWVDLKVSQGWKSHNIEGVFILEKSLPMGLSFLYAPEVEWAAVENLEKFIENIKKIAEESHSLFFRLEILDEKDPKIVKNLKNLKFIKSFEELQPEWRQIVDISKSEEEILNQMKPKGRYNIRVAQKHGVEVSVCPIDRLNDGIEIFYDLYYQTARYQKLSHRDKKYFLEMLKVLYPKDEAAILIARYQNLPLSALIITFYNGEADISQKRYDGVASYLYGGTSRLHKNVMAPYLAHWEAIKLAKKKGCRYYDLLAVAPEGSENHQYSNLTFFKEQFGGRKINITGSYDLVYKPVGYKIFKVAERLRRR